MKRASTSAKKEERRTSIIQRARAYLAARSFEEVRLEDLARELGLVKGTLYLYFPTKQDLFAFILKDEMTAWWRAYLAAPPSASPGGDLAKGLTERPLLVRLIASLHMNIEPGLSPEGLRALKSWFRDFAAQASRDLESRYGGIEGKGMRLLLGIYALTVGASQLAFPPGTVRKLIETDDELEVFRIRFDEFLTASIDSLIYGTRRA